MMKSPVPYWLQYFAIEGTLNFKPIEKEKIQINLKNNVEYCNKIIYPTESEVKLHKAYLKNKFTKNFFK